MKNKNRNAENARLHIPTDDSGENVLLAKIDPYSRMIMNYEIWNRSEVETQRKGRKIKEMYERVACRLTQIRPRDYASRDMKPLTIKEFEELVKIAISRGNKCDS
jgi:hypothetical protein